MARAYLIKRNIDRLSKPGCYSDTKLVGFGLRISDNGTKTYIVKRKAKIDGQPKVVTVKIGTSSHWTPEQARDRAKELNRLLDTGCSPNELERRRAIVAKQEEQVRAVETKKRGVTFEQAFGKYLTAPRHSRTLSNSTVEVYRYQIHKYCSNWMQRPLVEISRGDLIALSEQLKETASKSILPNLMRVLRAVFTFSYEHYEVNGEPLLAENPFNRLKRFGWTAPLPRRQSVIATADLPRWYQAVLALQNEVTRDALLLMLFCGFRKSEVCSLPWSAIDFEQDSITLSTTKNGRPFQFPMSGFVHDLLRGREQYRDAFPDFVFPGEDGHIKDLRYAVETVTELSGVVFMPHDLRRTFETTAAGLGISHYLLKDLLNHAHGGDCTAGYIVSTRENMREPVNQITAKLLKYIRHGNSMVQKGEDLLPLELDVIEAA